MISGPRYERTSALVGASRAELADDELRAIEAVLAAPATHPGG